MICFLFTYWPFINHPGFPLPFSILIIRSSSFPRASSSAPLNSSTLPPSPPLLVQYAYSRRRPDSPHLFEFPFWPRKYNRVPPYTTPLSVFYLGGEGEGDMDGGGGLEAWGGRKVAFSARTVVPHFRSSRCGGAKSTLPPPPLIASHSLASPPPPPSQDTALQ